MRWCWQRFRWEQGVWRPESCHSLLPAPARRLKREKGKIRPRISKTQKNKDKEPNPLSGEGKGVNFYAKVLAEAEKLDFEAAAGIDGIDDEIAIFRLKIRSILAREPNNIKLLMAATGMLTKLVKARYSMNQKQEKSLGEAIKNIIKDIGVPLGVAVINKKL